jgi:TetR/AcrR family transcriptional regulator
MTARGSSAPAVRLTGAQRRKEILSAAQSVFAKSGLAGARTSQIADAAGVAESMLYKHFASKRDIFDAAVIDPVSDFVEHVVDNADSIFRDDEADGGDFYRSLMDTMTEVLPLLGAALFSDSVEGARFYNSKIVPLLDRYEEKIRASMTEVPGADVDASFLARALIGIVYVVVLDTSFRDEVSSTPAGRQRDADEMRAFVASALTDSRPDALLDLLATHADGTVADRPPRPAVVGSGPWERYWDAMAAGSAASRKRLEELERENETLRRIVSDQAIELRRATDPTD